MTKRERLFDENKFLSLLWKLQRSEESKTVILDEIDESIRRQIKAFSEEIMPEKVLLELDDSELTEGDQGYNDALDEVKEKIKFAYKLRGIKP